MTTNKPKLRFPEFSDNWEEKKLGEIADFLAGYAFKSVDMKLTRCKYQLIKMTNVYLNELRLDRNPSYWEELDKQEQKYLLQKNDIVITLTGTTGKTDFGYSALIPENEKYLLNQRLAAIRGKADKGNTIFVSHIIKRHHFLTAFFNEAKGGTGNQANISIEDIKCIKIQFPTLPEQTKIANFLTAVDEKINLLKEKKSLLEAYKKGVMQQLFTQVVRFKKEDGSDFEDWEEKSLGEIGTFFSGGTPLTTKKDFFGGKIPFIRSGEINSNKTEQFITELGLKNSSAKKVEIGDILYAMYGATSGEVAISKISGAINQAILCIRTTELNYFIYYFLQLGKDKILKTYLQGGQGNLSAEIIKSLSIPVPPIEEQQKIASFLSAIDEKIAAVAQAIEATQVYKKGLLQQLFC